MEIWENFFEILIKSRKILKSLRQRQKKFSEYNFQDNLRKLEESSRKNTGCSKLVFTVLKKLLATKSMKKTTSKTAISRKNMPLSVITMVWLGKYPVFLLLNVS